MPDLHLWRVAWPREDRSFVVWMLGFEDKLSSGSQRQPAIDCYRSLDWLKAVELSNNFGVASSSRHLDGKARPVLAVATGMCGSAVMPHGLVPGQRPYEEWNTLLPL